jgi:hypothetical protein
MLGRLVLTPNVGLRTNALNRCTRCCRIRSALPSSSCARKKSRISSRSARARGRNSSSIMIAARSPRRMQHGIHSRAISEFATLCTLKFWLQQRQFSVRKQVNFCRHVGECISDQVLLRRRHCPHLIEQFFEFCVLVLHGMNLADQKLGGQRSIAICPHCLPHPSRLYTTHSRPAGHAVAAIYRLQSTNGASPSQALPTGAISWFSTSQGHST